MQHNTANDVTRVLQRNEAITQVARTMPIHSGIAVGLMEVPMHQWSLTTVITPFHKRQLGKLLVRTYRV